MKELAKQYDPSQVEDRIYQFWLDGGYFHTKADPDKKPYTIVMPPPNVTGQLHMGHAVDNTMQDILIRTKRMQGYAALWVPGTDHASIATEAKVVEAMRAEGLTKEMVGRDGFLERAWAWKTKYGNRIVSQLKKLGSSCDWERERLSPLRASVFWAAAAARRPPTSRPCAQSWMPCPSRPKPLRQRSFPPGLHRRWKKMMPSCGS